MPPRLTGRIGYVYGDGKICSWDLQLTNKIAHTSFTPRPLSAQYIHSPATATRPATLAPKLRTPAGHTRPVYSRPARRHRTHSRPDHPGPAHSRPVHRSPGKVPAGTPPTGHIPAPSASSTGPALPSATATIRLRQIGKIFAFFTYLCPVPISVKLELC
jgi:hypothetical protein